MRKKPRPPSPNRAYLPLDLFRIVKGYNRKWDTLNKTVVSPFAGLVAQGAALVRSTPHMQAVITANERDQIRKARLRMGLDVMPPATGGFVYTGKMADAIRSALAWKPDAAAVAAINKSVREFWADLRVRDRAEWQRLRYNARQGKRPTRKLRKCQGR